MGFCIPIIANISYQLERQRAAKTMSSNSSSSSMASESDNIQNKRVKSTGSAESNGNILKKSKRRCMFGCIDGSSTLCRFPVHDAQRCQDWVDFFQVSEDHIRDNSLVNLRVCMKHFKEKITMRNGKLSRHPSADSVSSNHSSRGAKRSRKSSVNGCNDDAVSGASSVYSDYTSDSEQKPKFIFDPNIPISKIKANGNRKLFVIENKTAGSASGQSSKMFLILENGDDNDHSKKHQKITLIADKSDQQTAEKIEQLLPQLIQKIQNPKVSIKPEDVILINSDDEHAELNVKKNDIKLQIKKVETLANMSNPPPSPPKSVNVSPDFLFLMKMVPKLEAIAEPIKTHIKDRIESMLSEPLNEIAFEDSYVPKISTVTSLSTT